MDDWHASKKLRRENRLKPSEKLRTLNANVVLQKKNWIRQNQRFILGNL